MRARLLTVSCIVARCASAGPLVADPRERDLPGKLLIGYWHNWTGSPATLSLTEVSADYDVVIVAFATPTVPSGSTMQFVPDPGIYPTTAAFIADIQALQAEGRTVLISIGGAADPVVVDDSASAGEFVASMSGILDTYGFDGVDVDLEGGSLALDPGDVDYRVPTSPRIVCFIEALSTLMAMYPDHVLSAAPETACVQGGYQAYGGIWGAYLPVIHALRERWTFIHVQQYNTGSMFGRDGTIYEPATADFHVAMADMLLGGFTVDVWGSAIPFEPLRQDQVAIGLPAGPLAGDGYTEPDVVRQALDYLISGSPYGGQYILADPDGYPDFRGLMTWSVNWDSYYGWGFSSGYRGYLDSLMTGVSEEDLTVPGAASMELQAFPGPARENVSIRYVLPTTTDVRCEIVDLGGRILLDRSFGCQSAGEQVIRLDLSDLPAGLYLLRVATGGGVLGGCLTVVP